MAETAEPPRKRQRRNQFETRQRELAKRREAQEQRKLQEERRLQQRIDGLKTVEDIPLDNKMIKYCQYIIDSGKECADKMSIGSNTTTKNAISAFKLYQMTKKVERIVDENPRDAIEYGVIIRKFKGIETMLPAVDDDEEKQEEKTQQKTGRNFNHYFAVFNANFGHFNYHFDFKRVQKDAPKLLGVPLNECKYVKIYGNAVIMTAQSSFLKVFQLQSQLADKELKKRFRRRRQFACDDKWPKCIEKVQEIVQKKERKEVKRTGLKEQGYMHRIINVLCKKLPIKVKETFEQGDDDKMKQLVDEYSFRVSRRLIIMSMHQLFSRADKRYNSD